MAEGTSSTRCGSRPDADGIIRMGEWVGSPEAAATVNGEPFDRSRWYVAGASPEATAEEQRRVEVCESYIRSARWGDGTPASVRALVAMNVRGAWPVAYTQGWNDAAQDAELIQLLHELDGHLGLAVHRGEAPDDPRWKNEATDLIGRIRQLTERRRG